MQNIKDKNQKLIYIACPNRDQEKRKNIIIQDKKAYYVARYFSLLIDNDDTRIVVPNIESNISLSKFWNFCCENTNIKNEQAIWTSGKSYVVYDDCFEIKNELDDLIKLGYTIVPNSTNVDSIDFIFSINANNYILESEDFVSKYKTKKWLHPTINSNELAFDNLREYTPRGYVCDSLNDLKKAYNILQKERDGVYYIKPTEGVGGGGIVKVKSFDDIKKYKFTRQVVLEEFMNVDRYYDGTAITPSVQYFGTNVITVIDQLVDGVSYVGSVYPPRITEDVKQSCIQICQDTINNINPVGYGGFDLVVVDNKPYIIDPNTCRFTGAYPAYAFWEKNKDNYFGFISFVLIPKYELDEFWKMLTDINLAYDKSNNKNIAVFPLVYLNDICQLIILTNNYDDMFSTRQIMIDMFAK